MSNFAGKCLGAGLMLFGSVAMGALQVEVVTGATPGGAVSVDVDYTIAATVENFQASLSYDTGVLTFVSCTVVAGGGFYPVACDGATAGTITLLTSNIAGSDIPTFAPLVTVAFTSAATASAPTAITIASSTYTAAGSVIVPPTDESDGSVAFVIAPIGELTLSAATTTISVVAGGSGAIDVNLANSGNATLNVSACTSAETTAGTAVTLAGSLGATAIPVSGSATATLSCNAAAGALVGDMVVAELSCAHDGSNATPQVLGGLTCNVVAAPPAQIAVTPEPLALSGFISGAVGGSLTVTNTAAAGSDDLTGISCAYAGDAEISVAALSATTLAPGAGASAVVSCDSAAAGAFAGTYTCASSLPTTVNNISCNIATAPPPPEFIPTLSQWAMILMALVLAGFAGLTLYRREGFEA